MTFDDLIEKVRLREDEYGQVIESVMFGQNAYKAFIAHVKKITSGVSQEDKSLTVTRIVDIPIKVNNFAPPGAWIVFSTEGKIMLCNDLIHWYD